MGAQLRLGLSGLVVLGQGQQLGCPRQFPWVHLFVGHRAKLWALWQRAAGQLSCWCCHLVQVVLVSARRLWKDLQDFCCSQGKCNFHDNSNLNCTLKVRGAGAPVHV